MKKILVVLLFLAVGCNKIDTKLSQSDIADLCSITFKTYINNYPGKNTINDKVDCKYLEYPSDYPDPVHGHHLLTYTFYNGEQVTIDANHKVNFIKLSH